jgi:hypothetical protein
MFIGQFHTLCNGVPANTTAIIPMQTGITVGTPVTLCDYFKNQDLDFANFYTKNIDAVNDGTHYAVATVLHPLQGFNTGDILPESVWCLNFHPTCKNWDGMVYCNNSNVAVDIYLQSGSGTDTCSEYGSVIPNHRRIQNHMSDLNSVGKFLTNYNIFTNLALGSNERTVSNVDNYISGGHVDTSGRRMISNIGCEDCCGYREQYVSFNLVNPNASYDNTDGRGLFGNTSDVFGPTLVGGDIAAHAPNYVPGSRAINGAPNISDTTSYRSCRGICNISIV